MLLSQKLMSLIQAYSISIPSLTNALNTFESIGGLTAYNRLIPCFNAFVKHKGARKLMLAITAKFFAKTENFTDAASFLKSTAEKFMESAAVKDVLHRRMNGSHIMLWQPKRPEFAKSKLYDSVHYLECRHAKKGGFWCKH